jgi:hypothetical protein
MKKILFFLICFTTIHIVQAQNTAYSNRMQYIFSNIDKTKVSTGYLKEFGIRFANLEDCNGSLSPNNFVNKTEWNEIYSSLYSMRVGTMAQNMVAPSVVNSNCTTLQSNATEILLAVQHYNYQQYKTTAQTNGDVVITNDKIYDVSGRNPYDTKTVFAITSLKNRVQGTNFNFKLPSNLVYSNVGQTINQISIDYNNGQGYLNVGLNEVKNVAYFSSGEKMIKIKFQYTNGTVVESHSKIIVDFSNPNQGTYARFNGDNLLIDEEIVTGNPWNGFSATGKITVELAPGHTN